MPLDSLPPLELSPLTDGLQPFTSPPGRQRTSSKRNHSPEVVKSEAVRTTKARINSPPSTLEEPAAAVDDQPLNVSRSLVSPSTCHRPADIQSQDFLLLQSILILLIQTRINRPGTS